MNQTYFNEFICEGRFKIKNIIGKGTYSIVYDCYDPEQNRRLLIKSIQIRELGERLTKEVIKSQLSKLPNFDHDHLVKFIEYIIDESKNTLYLCLDYLSGYSLEEILNTHPEKYSINWRVQQALGLINLFIEVKKRGLSHQRLKASNIIFDAESETLKVMDFCLSSILDNYGIDIDDKTQADKDTHQKNEICKYEQIENTSDNNDLYELGFIIVSLLAWKFPTERLTEAKLKSFLPNEIQNIISQESMQKIIELLSGQNTNQINIYDLKAPFQDIRYRCNPIPIILTKAVKDKAASMGMNNPFEDINKGFHAVYDTNDKNDSILCVGQSVIIRLVKSNEDLNKLKAVDMYKRETWQLESDREKGISTHLQLVEGIGDAKLLIDLAQSHHGRRLENLSLIKNMDKFFKIPKYILKKEQDRLECIRIEYELQEEGHQLVRLKVLAAKKCLFGDSEVKLLHGEIDPEFRSWISCNDVFTYKDKQIGNYHGYDKKLLSIKISKKIKLPKKGLIICEDQAQRIVIDRQQTALNDFEIGKIHNPNLLYLLMNPNKNELEPRVPIKLTRQDLDPQADISDLVSRMNAAKDLFLLQGPPGTGKTTVITELICHILLTKPDARILLTSQANEAVNNAVEALRAQKKQLNKRWRIVRDARDELCDLDNIGFEADYLNWSEGTRSLSALSSATNEAKVEEVLKDWRELLGKKSDLKNDYAYSVQVWATTLLRTPTIKKLIPELHFDYVIIDEAARATTAELFVAMNYGKKIVLVGDHKQLPPFFSNETREDLEKARLCVEEATRSLFEDLFENMPNSNKATLKRQYRMHSSIGKMVSDLYYPEIGLEHGTPDMDRSINLPKIFSGNQRVIWLNCDDGCSLQDKGSTSYYNNEEINAIRDLLQTWAEHLKESEQKYTVGIITAYSAQKEKIKKLIKSQERYLHFLDIKVDTVDAFQGKQEDIIICSLVKSNTSQLKFISDPNRLNVAFSRAKRLLVIVGQIKSAKLSPNLNAVIESIPKDAQFEIKKHK